MSNCIKNLFILICCFSFSCAYANKNYTIHCPLKIAMKQNISQAYPGWRALATEPNYYFSGVTLYSGKPEEMASLKPESTQGKSKWTFSADEQIYVVCEYNQTSIQLTQPLPAHITQCVVEFHQDRMSVLGPIPKQITCSSVVG